MRLRVLIFFQKLKKFMMISHKATDIDIDHEDGSEVSIEDDEPLSDDSEEAEGSDDEDESEDAGNDEAEGSDGEDESGDADNDDAEGSDDDSDTEPEADTEPEVSDNNGDSDEDGDDEIGSGDDEDEEDEEGNSGWADAMHKVLAMGKNSDKPVSVLSKAKKDNVKTKSGDTVVGENGEQKIFEPLAVRKARKKEIDMIGRVMPNVLERNAEKALSRIATKGVVQLFNAVRDHQKDMKVKLKEAGGSFRKQEKVYKSLDKGSFVEMLTGKKMSKSSEGPSSKKAKIEVKDEEPSENSTWSILRDDYMLGAKLKDWDKESDGEN